MKVYAKTKELHELLAHPRAGKLRGEFGGDIETDWPEDMFTLRRIRDGDIATEPPTRREVREAEAERPAPATGLSRAAMEEMTISQLRAEAERLRVRVPAKATQAEIITAILEK
jgi:hypothetical protein